MNRQPLIRLALHRLWKSLRGCTGWLVATGRDRTISRRSQIGLVAYMLAFVAPFILSTVCRAAGPKFEKDILPILQAHCWKCHGGENLKAGLDLRSLPLMLQGGRNGPVLVRGSAEQSLLMKKLRSGEMPPGDELKPTIDQIGIIASWINSGAVADYEQRALTAEEDPQPTDSDHQWWSFKPPIRPAVPNVVHFDRVRTPIDAFVLRKLEQNGLGFSEDADRRSLVRRIYFDLVGLAPTPEVIDDFVADRKPDVWERLIDCLLESPHYGERWGRHWLDAAGYVDTQGPDNDADALDPREEIWKYRDYVMTAFNSDTPYDQFLLEQLAGDELVDWRNRRPLTPRMKRLLSATGFLRQASDSTSAAELNTADIRHQVLYDTVQIVATNLLGLTFQCAQCHSHKFDPLTQADYFRFAGLFQPAYDAANWLDPNKRVVASVSNDEKEAIDEKNSEIDRKVAELGGEIFAIRFTVAEQILEESISELAEDEQRKIRDAIATSAGQRTAKQNELIANYRQKYQIDNKRIDNALDAETEKRIAKLHQQIADQQAQRRSYEIVQALWDVGPPRPVYLYRRGDFRFPGPEVRPGVPVVLDDLKRPFLLAKNQNDGTSSGYRTALAHWLTKPDHPLTARVFVNRIWQQYFGRGIVASPDNFGRSGNLPTHPELLDWLAVEFIESGWSLKHLHRLITRSTVYRQSSRTRSINDGSSIDPENRLLWRMPLRRKESEVVRDTILACAGTLNESLYGSPVPLQPKSDGRVTIAVDRLRSAGDQYRRSLYLFNRRNYHLTELSVFDQPTVSHNCTRRESTAVVSQNLALLNGEFANAQALFLARQILWDCPSGSDSSIRRAFELILSRPPDPQELTLSDALLRIQFKRYRTLQGTTNEAAERSALAHLCLMLFNSNEFLYID